MTTLKEIWQAEVARVIVPLKLMAVGFTTLVGSMAMIYVMFIVAGVQNSLARWATLSLSAAVSLLGMVGALIVLVGFVIYCFPSLPVMLAKVRKKRLTRFWVTNGK